MKTFKTLHTPEIISVNTPNKETNCNSILLWNKGTEIIALTINGGEVAIGPGDHIQFTATNNSILDYTIDIAFAGGGTPSLLIIKETIIQNS